MAGYKDPPKETQFQPGQSGNPAGSSKRQRLASALIRQIEDKGLDDKLAMVGLKAALEGDFRFWQAIFDRVDGKPREATEETQADDGTQTLRDFLADPDPPKKGKARKARPAG